MGQGGNAWEWMETEYDGTNDSSGSSRGLRGGAWQIYDIAMLSSSRYSDIGGPSAVGTNVGFRVASLAVPEPTSILLTMLAGSLMLIRRKR
jgi:formylglycine-generating enzyme required for sulfatase activity